MRQWYPVSGFGLEVVILAGDPAGGALRLDRPLGETRNKFRKRKQCKTTRWVGHRGLNKEATTVSGGISNTGNLLKGLPNNLTKHRKEGGSRQIVVPRLESQTLTAGALGVCYLWKKSTTNKNTFKQNTTLKKIKPQTISPSTVSDSQHPDHTGEWRTPPAAALETQGDRRLKLNYAESVC